MDNTKPHYLPQKLELFIGGFCRPFFSVKFTKVFCIAHLSMMNKRSSNLPLSSGSVVGRQWISAMNGLLNLIQWGSHPVYDAPFAWRTPHPLDTFKLLHLKN